MLEPRSTTKGDRACVQPSPAPNKGRDLRKCDVKKHVILSPNSTNLVRLNKRNKRYIYALILSERLLFHQRRFRQPCSWENLRGQWQGTADQWFIEFSASSVFISAKKDMKWTLIQASTRIDRHIQCQVATYLLVFVKRQVIRNYRWIMGWNRTQMEKVWRRVGLHSSRKKRDGSGTSRQQEVTSSTSAPQEAEYQNIHTLRTADLIRQRQGEEKSTLRSSYIIRNGDNFILVERRRRRRRRSGTRASSGGRHHTPPVEENVRTEQKRRPPTRLKLFGIQWPLHSSDSRYLIS